MTLQLFLCHHMTCADCDDDGDDGAAADGDIGDKGYDCGLGFRLAREDGDYDDCSADAHVLGAECELDLFGHLEEDRTGR